MTCTGIKATPAGFLTGTMYPFKASSRGSKSRRGGGAGVVNKVPKPGPMEREAIIKSEQETNAPEMVRLAQTALTALQRMQEIEEQMAERISKKQIERHYVEGAMFSENGPGTVKEAIAFVVATAQKAEGSCRLPAE